MQEAVFRPEPFQLQSFLTRQEKYVKLEKSISEERRYSRMMYTMVMLMCNTVFGAF